MAPSARTSNGRVSKPQTSLRSFSKVTKSTPAPVDAQIARKQSAVLAQLSNEARPRTTPIATSKRKRGNESEDEEGAIEELILKKAKTLPTPPRSRQSSEDELHVPKTRTIKSVTHKLLAHLPSPLQELVLLHENFLKAFSIHVAHNGPGTPAELISLTKTITNLYKKHAVSKADIQRMLALYEIDSTSHTTNTIPKAELKAAQSPFKLLTSGVGTNSRTCIEYTSNELFREHELQSRYRSHILAIYSSHSTDSTSFVHNSVENYPVLSCAIGVQTQLRKEQASATRQELLKLSSAAQQRSSALSSLPNFSGLSIRDTTTTINTSNDNDSQAPVASQAVKSRTLNLFDRVKARQLSAASSTTGDTNTAALMTRRHAIGRIAEVVEILRMKQNQKSSSLSPLTDLVTPIRAILPSDTSRVTGKISFSMRQLATEIKASLATPLNDEEINVCFEILAKEIPGGWLRVFELGSVKSVVLCGNGTSGVEVKRFLEQKE